MKLIDKIKTTGIAGIAALLLFSSCNKVETAPTPLPIDTTTTGITLSATLAASADDSLFNRMVVRSGLNTLLNTRTLRFTLIVPNNAAMRVLVNSLSGGAVPVAAPDAVHSAFLANTLPVANAQSLVNYNILPQKVLSSSFPTTFPNLQYASNLNPAPTLSPLARLGVHLSKRNGNYINNIPFTTLDVLAANGVIHKTPAFNAPPQRAMWERINTDNALTYLKAAIQRADSGLVATNTSSLIWALSNFGPNLTVFAPTDAAFQATLTAVITQALIAQGVPPATAAAQAAALSASPTVFSNPALYGSLTAQTVKGIVVYHILGSRAFSVNFPTTATNYPTLLNTAVPTHPGVGLQATFTGPSVSAATVKGAVNATAAAMLINPTPDGLPSYGATAPAPFAYTGTSDQHYINGTLHKINQVLLPQ